MNWLSLHWNDTAEAEVRQSTKLRLWKAITSVHVRAYNEGISPRDLHSGISGAYCGQIEHKCYH